MFLDSCVFHAYAIRFEGINHEKSKLLFQSDIYQRYTSSNVIQEIKLKKKKRLKIYEIAIEYLNKGKKIEDISFEKHGIHLSNNDEQHLKMIFDNLSSESDFLSSLRLFTNMYKKLLEDSLKKIVEVFQSVHKPYLIALLSDDIHSDDAKIIVDAYYWSNGRNDPKYVTIERVSIFNNRDKILTTLHDYCEDFPITSLQLKNILEIV